MSAGRQAGRRRGPLGHVGLEVLELLANLVSYRSGRLEPAITYLMGKLKRSKDAVVRALAALREHGFLDCGLTGKDWVENNGSDVARLAEMTFSKASNKPTRWVIAVPEE